MKTAFGTQKTIRIKYGEKQTIKQEEKITIKGYTTLYFNFKQFKKTTKNKLNASYKKTSSLEEWNSGFKRNKEVLKARWSFDSLWTICTTCQGS